MTGTAPRIPPRPPRLRVMVSPDRARGAAEDAERGSGFLGVLDDAEGESAKKTRMSKLHHFRDLLKIPPPAGQPRDPLRV
jgi:hypothetical protein